MTTEVGSAFVSVLPSTRGFGTSLQRQVGPEMDSAGRRTGSRFGSAFKSAARVGIFGGIALAAGALKVGADALGEAQEARKVGRLTGAVIKSTGGAAKVTERQVGKLSGRLSVMAGVDDEVVQQGSNVLLTFKGIRNETGKGNKIFDQANKATLNLSAALGKDLKGSAIQVGKALNDPIAGTTALGRAGVQFTEDQKEQIKTLTESGDLLGAQKIILRELDSQFGGAARSQTNSSERMKVAFDNVKESLGTGLLPLVDRFSRFLIRDGVPAAEQFSDWFTKKGVPAIEDFIEKARPVVDRVLPQIRDAFKDIKTFAGDAGGAAETMLEAFNGMPAWVKKILVGGAVAGVAVKITGLDKVFGAASAIRGSTPLTPMYVKVVGGLPAGLSDGGGGGKSGKFAKFGKLVPIVGRGGVIIGMTVLAAYLVKERIAPSIRDTAPSPTGVNPAARRLLGTGMGSDDPDKTARAYVNLQNQYDLSKAKLSLLRDETVKFNSTVDKTPRQVEVLFKSKGYLERMREIEALNAALASVGAGGVPNVGADESPRGFGAGDYGIFAGANVNVTANTTAELAAAARAAKRKAARAGN
jgi:hypothetical protein